MLCILNNVFPLIKPRYLVQCVIALTLTSYSASAFSGNLLTDQQLANISAGSAGVTPDPGGNSPNSNGQIAANDIALAGDTNSSAGQPAPEQWESLNRHDDISQNNYTNTNNDNHIVEAGSRASVVHVNRITLKHASQSNLSAINISNSSQSSIVNTVNLNSNNDSTQVHQLNQVEQSEFQQASHGNNSLTTTLLEAHIKSEKISFLSSESFSDYRANYSRRNVNSNNNVDVGVEPFSPDLFMHLGEIGTIIPEWSLDIIPSVNFDAIYEGPLGDEWGLAGSYSGLTLTGPTLAVNGLRPSGDDLILEVEFNLPELDMGKITVEGCVATCSDLSLNLGSIGGGSIIDGNEIVLAGMNPIKDMQLNLNSGVAVAGLGNFSASDSSIGIGGELATHFGAYFDFTLDLSDVWWVDDLFGVNKWSHRENLDYEINIPFTILDHDIDGFTANFEGSVCLKLFGNNASCGILEYEYEESLYTDNSREFSQTNEYSSSSIIDESKNRELVHGAILKEAEAELIVMVNSNLEISTDSDVVIYDNAQQSSQAINVVNSAATISANSLNIDMSRHSSINASAYSGVLLNQRNYFKQKL